MTLQQAAGYQQDTMSYSFPVIPGVTRNLEDPYWIPAFAGMTLLGNPVARLVDEPIGSEPFDKLRVSSRVEKLRADLLKSSRYRECSISRHMD